MAGVIETPYVGTFWLCDEDQGLSEIVDLEPILMPTDRVTRFYLLENERYQGIVDELGNSIAIDAEEELMTPLIFTTKEFNRYQAGKAKFTQVDVLNLLPPPHDPGTTPSGATGFRFKDDSEFEFSDDAGFEFKDS